ncbi:hypothetical protein AXE80_03500 [Wenyingzhuangia fucanilytica]|uniref:CBM6 domain-containing protein n=1 Tax=Wenyingzhuangia fucanilytica TaxID=1790137 RepID=A0A1B1Y3T4_9FLAO|nr:T9SS type A sorting domain-containing protein [Wenyingzhuangia fucanilytica]ANW95399.1 hypothetical protein AXE80_03500 [Wenyingzhuangia fucanilytica]
MKKQNYFSKFKTLLFVCLISSGLNAQTTINSLTELKTYITQDNVNAVMTPGTYVINSTITGTGNLLPDPIMFEFTGSNSTYDFTGVTFEFNTEILNDYGNVEVVELRIYGDNNVLKNLTMEDIGTDAPRKRARAIHLDGLNNRIEGFHITVQGSYPYGYGDLFGKGGTNTVIGHRKHSGILVRGDGNHIKDCTMIHRSYGHGIFIQGGKNVLIEGVYMEGDDLRTTDDVLAEAGTGSPADNVAFMTTWGYTVPAGYMFSKQEDGIRTYASAGLYSNDKTGATTTSSTENVTIKNCTVKRMRGAYSLAFGGGSISVENSSAIECEGGFGIISGGLIQNCSADAKYGMVYGNAYNTNKNITADITILNSDGGYGPHQLAYVGGSDNDITFRSSESYVSQGRKIQLAGEKNDMRMLNGVNPSQTRHNSSSNTIVNESDYPILLDSGSVTIDSTTYTWDASNNTIQSCGTVTDNGTSNTVSTTSCGTSSNLALNGVASQSSLDHGGVASRAIDGNTNGKWSNNSVTHTLSESGAWWQVDLGSDRAIGDISIFNRTDSCCKARLSDFTVSVISANGTTVYSQTFTSVPDPSVSLNAGGAIGKIIKVDLNVTNPLSLAEVEVYEYEGPTPTTFTIQENTTGFCGVEGTVDSNNTGYTGTGFSNTTNTLGAGVDWSIDGVAGDYTFVWRYASTSNRAADLIVDGNTVASNIAFNSTGVWTSWTAQYVTVNLGAGVKDVRLEAVTSSGLGNIDYLEVTGPDSSTASCPSSSRVAKSNVEILESESNNNLLVYPNPVSNNLTVSLKNTSFDINETIVKIYNVNGQKVLESTFTNEEVNLVLEKLNKGMYILELSDGKQIKVEKIFKL